MTAVSQNSSQPRPIPITKPLRTIVLMWLAWGIVLVAFQAFVTARFQPERPDTALFWTADQTTADAQNDKIYLIEPFLNNHVAWDSEFYLSIAVVGYDDPEIRTVTVTAVDVREVRQGMSIPVITTLGEAIPLNYAFLPMYPMAIRLISFPLRILGLNPIATATLAGVIVSMLGALVGMIALYDLTKDKLGHQGGLRTAFYFIIFPTAMFFGQVYTEGLFVGLAFGALAMANRKMWVWAAVLAVGATLTRAIGVALFIPLIWPWIQSGDWMDLDLEWRELYFRGVPWRAVGKAIIHLAPLFAFLIWRFSFNGIAFKVVEEVFFGRNAFAFGRSFSGLFNAVQLMFDENGPSATYYSLEVIAIALGIYACLATRKKYPALSWYGLLTIILALTSGSPQGMHRYILAAPSVFILLSQWGKHEWFDRAWTIASLLLMGLLATLFSFNFWVG